VARKRLDRRSNTDINPRRFAALGDRLTAGRQTLDLPIGGRIPIPEQRGRAQVGLTRPHSLTVRTSASHAEIPGSSPGGVTNQRSEKAALPKGRRLFAAQWLPKNFQSPSRCPIARRARKGAGARALGPRPVFNPLRSYGCEANVRLIE